jgi:hypothetical protein
MTGSDAFKIWLYGGENNQIAINWDCKGYRLPVHASNSAHRHQFRVARHALPIAD